VTAATAHSRCEPVGSIQALEAIKVLLGLARR
jgi:hypothetical protein